MRDPLAVAGARIRARVAAKHIGVHGVEAGIPDSLPVDFAARQVVDFLDIPAEASGADLGAICAAQAAPGDLVIHRVFQVI